MLEASQVDTTGICTVASKSDKSKDPAESNKDVKNNDSSVLCKCLRWEYIFIEMKLFIQQCFNFKQLKIRQWL